MDEFNDRVDYFEGGTYTPSGADTFQAVKSRDLLGGGNGTAKEPKASKPLRPTVTRLSEIYEDKSKKNIIVPGGNLVEQLADPSWLTYEERSELQSGMATELFKAGIALPKNPADLPKVYLQMLQRDAKRGDVTSETMEEKRYSIDEIAKMRSEERIDTTGHTKRVREYQTPEGVVSIYRRSPDASVANISQTMQDMLKRKQSEEGYTFETLLVNALIEQYRIAKMFNLPKDGVWNTITLDYVPSNSLADSDGYVHAQALGRRVDYLKQKGLSDDQVVTELAGHIFHESIHRADESGLLGDKVAFAEVTTVTAQLAYYLVKGYNGPNVYDVNRYSHGLRKINNGTHDARDYDIATMAAMTYLYGSLKETFPQFSPGSNVENPYLACEEMISKLSPDERMKLIPALKQAIMQSTDELAFRRTIAQVKDTISKAA